MPTMFHTASIWLTIWSIWLTVCLAVQRYVSVSRLHPSAAVVNGRHCGIILLIVTVYAVAALSQICRFFEFRFAQF